MRVRYGAKRIRAVEHFRRLNHTRAFGSTLELKYRSSQEFFYAQASIGVRRGHPRGHLTWNTDEGSSCRVERTVDYRHDRISLSFPAACIGSPKWVRVRVLAVSRRSHALFDIDDLPAQRGRVSDFGPRIHRA